MDKLLYWICKQQRTRQRFPEAIVQRLKKELQCHRLGIGMVGTDRIDSKWILNVIKDVKFSYCAYPFFAFSTIPLNKEGRVS